MKTTDAQKYFALLLKVYALEEKLRLTPPEDPAAYAAAAGEVAELYSEIAALVSAGRITAGDIVSAHARNQQVWPDSKPRQPNDPPGALYENNIDHYPTNPPYRKGDHIYDRKNGLWFITRRDSPVVGFPGAQYLGDVE